MTQTPKALRAVIAIAGRTNAGKSSWLNLIAGQDIAITSPVAGTTTDVVEKSMELRPIGPVLFLDTAGLDDASQLGAQRMAKTRKALERADVMVLVVTAGCWGAPEEGVLDIARERNVRCIVVCNQCDRMEPSAQQLEEWKARSLPVLAVNSLDYANREAALTAFTAAVEASLPEDFVNPPPLLADLVQPGMGVVLIVPVDIQAPKGRLILPQQQCLRDALDCDCMPMVCKETGYRHLLDSLKTPPGLVICDSQVVDLMVRLTPPEIPCTTFSILFSRLKGDMELLIQGAEALRTLRPGDRILMAEACTHHASCDDIGRVKIPRWLEKKIGGALQFDYSCGHDFPEELSMYRLIIHCGSCMLNRRETVYRLRQAQAAGIPVTNYGMCISYCQGVLDRVLSPFRR